MKKLFYLFVVLTIFFPGCSPSAQKYINKAKVKYDLQDYKGAILNYTRALEINPASAEAYYNRGMTKKAFVQNCVGMSVSNNEVKPIDSRSTGARASFGGLFQFSEGEIDDYNKAIALNPEYANAYYSRGLAKLNSGQRDSACIDLRKAGALGITEAFEQIKVNCQ